MQCFSALYPRTLHFRRIVPVRRTTISVGFEKRGSGNARADVADKSMFIQIAGGVPKHTYSVIPNSGGKSVT